MLDTGLSLSEVEKKHQENGYNILPEKKPPSSIKIFISQLKSPLVYILLIAGIVTFFLKDFTDTIVIVFTVLLNTLLGYFQEKRAGQALYALKRLLQPIAQVIREGNILQIEVKDIVAGDLIILDKGDKIPADGHLIYINRFYANEAILTGESMPIEKKINDKVFMGTMVSSGQARFVVDSIGAATEIGKIAKNLDDDKDDTPLRRQLVNYSKWLSITVLALTSSIFIFGLIINKPIKEVFSTSVALAVSAIPEGLLVGLTVVLAIGMQRILSKKGLVRNLLSAETLGGVTTICVDKTGTLTQGIMQVADVVGDEALLRFQTHIANDLDDPVVIAAYEWNKQDTYDLDKYERLDSLPFTSENQYFCSLHKFDENSHIIFLNGAPEVLLEKSYLTSDQKEYFYQKIEELSSQGKRILGYARKFVDVKKVSIEDSDIQSDFEWVGMIAFSDPVRIDVKDSLEKTREAGIKLIVITGDYPKTTKSVLSQLGIEVEEKDIFLGSALQDMDDLTLAELLKKPSAIKIFARTKPEQKMKIVKTLKGLGEVVAMMGDGVNDAPALTASDIGIVVGEATDVAKESADLVLLDSSFKTIVLAVEEGRGIFDNIRKMILYLMSDAYVEILLISVAMFMGLPLPLTATQILWINIVTDGFPNLGLTVDPKSNNIMKNKPRSSKENVVSGWMKRLILTVSLSGAFFSFALFYYVYKTTGDERLARSVAFAAVGVKSLVYVFTIKTLREPAWKKDVFNNKWLIITVLIGFFVQLLPYIFAPLGRLFDTVPIGKYWIYVFGAAFLMLVVIELAKMLDRTAHNIKVAIKSRT